MKKKKTAWQWIKEVFAEWSQDNAQRLGRHGILCWFLHCPLDRDCARSRRLDLREGGRLRGMNNQLRDLLGEQGPKELQG